MIRQPDCTLSAGYSYLKGVLFWCSEEGGNSSCLPSSAHSPLSMKRHGHFSVRGKRWGYPSCEFLCQRPKSIGDAFAVISPFVVVSCSARRFRCAQKPPPPFTLHAMPMRGPVETAAESISLGAPLLPTAEEVPPLQCNFQHLTRIRRSAQYSGFPTACFPFAMEPLGYIRILLSGIGLGTLLGGG